MKSDLAQTEIEAPYELPEGWKWCRLGEVAEIARGGSPRPIEKYLTTAEDGINWIKIGDTEKNGKYIFATKEKIIKEGLSKTRYVEEGDFLLTNSMSFGRPYILKTSGCIHDGWLVIKQCTAYNQDFLYYLLSSSAVFSQFVSLAKGSTVKNLKSETVRQVILPLPPTLAEQQRIVNRIESMFTKLDEAKEKAQNVVDGFETRKAAILHKAFSGELTAKWRKENNPEESSKYLEKIKDKVEIRLDFKYWENTKLPESWCESTIGNLLYFAGRVGWKGLKAEEYTSEGPILLSVYNLNDGDEVSFNKINHITNERYDESPEIMVRKNDILLTKDGAGIGKLGYVNELPEKATINSSLLLIRPGDVANYKFIFYLLSGPALQNIVKERITGSATPHLFQRDIKEFVLPVPSLPEQQEIVRILDTVLEKESRAKEAAGAVLDQIALLKKSILARAFRGEL